MLLTTSVPLTTRSDSRLRDLVCVCVCVISVSFSSVEIYVGVSPVCMLTAYSCYFYRFVEDSCSMYCMPLKKYNRQGWW